MISERVAIIIISYNTKELLLDCIESARLSAPSAEIVVVDNASSDGSSESVHNNFPFVTLIQNEKNLGFGAACNQGIRASQADFVLLLNSDAVLTPEAFAALVECFSDRPRAGAAGCRVIDSQGSESATAMNFLTPWNQNLELLGIKFGRFGRTRVFLPEASEIDCSVDWLEGSCLMLRRAALDQVGLFDEQFFMYSEDEDLCRRLKSSGWAVCYTPVGSVTHVHGASSAGDQLGNLVHFYASQMKLLRKHRGAISSSLFRILTRFVLLIKLIKSSNRATRPDLRLRLKALKIATNEVHGA